MLDMFGPTSDQVNKSNMEHGTTSLAIISLLIKKGVFTEEEFLKERIAASARADQLWAEKKEQAEKEIKEKYQEL